MVRPGLEPEDFTFEGSRKFRWRVVGGASSIRFLGDGRSARFLVGVDSVY
jgi:hypothetical protein